MSNLDINDVKKSKYIINSLRYIKNLYNKYFISDEKFLKKKYKKIFGKEINLQEPKTFNEKR